MHAGASRVGARAPGGMPDPHCREARGARGRYSRAGGKMGRDRSRRRPIAVRLHAALLARSETVAAAESLTAGLFCATLATVPGASATLRGGVVVYATDLKTELAGVPADLLARARAGQPADRRRRWPRASGRGAGPPGASGSPASPVPTPSTGTGPGGSTSGSPTGGAPTCTELDLAGDRAAVRAARRRRGHGGACSARLGLSRAGTPAPGQALRHQRTRPGRSGPGAGRRVP